MPFNNNWYKKKRLHEQLKFFGAKKTRFISCYAKKPRIKIELAYKCEETGYTIHPDGTSEIDYTESRVRFLEEKFRQTMQQNRMDALRQAGHSRYGNDLLYLAQQDQLAQGLEMAASPPSPFLNHTSCLAASLWGNTL